MKIKREEMKKFIVGVADKQRLVMKIIHAEDWRDALSCHSMIEFNPSECDDLVHAKLLASERGQVMNIFEFKCVMWEVD